MEEHETMITKPEIMETNSKVESNEEMEVKNVGSASLWSSVMNLMNTIIGAGVLAMPYALSSTGFVGGVFVITIAGATSALGLYYLSLSAFKVERGKASFNLISSMTFPSAAIIFDIAIAITCFGALLSYLILIGDVMPQILRLAGTTLSETSILLNRRFWISMATLILTPMMFLRYLDSLRFVSFLSVLAIGYMSLIVIVFFFRKNIWNSNIEVNLIQGKGAMAFLSSMPVFIFAFSCQQNMFTIINEIRDYSHKSILRVILISIGLSFVIYMVFSLFGYFTFGNKVPENIILGYDFSIFTTIGRIAIVLMIILTYPLQAYPCRECINKLLSWRHRSKTALLNKPQDRMSNLRFYLITIFLILGSYGLAMVVRSFERVLAYVGTIGSTAISFILPGLYYFRLAYKEDIMDKNMSSENVNEETASISKISKRTKCLRLGSLLLAIYGIVIMIISLTMNIIHSAKTGV